MCSLSWEEGPEPDIDRWEENVWEQYEEYCEHLGEDDYIMSFEAFRNQIIKEIEEHIAELQESYI
jgi:hypothetical protein